MKSALWIIVFFTALQAVSAASVYTEPALTKCRGQTCKAKPFEKREGETISLVKRTALPFAELEKSTTAPDGLKSSIADVESTSNTQMENVPKGNLPKPFVFGQFLSKPNAFSPHGFPAHSLWSPYPPLSPRTPGPSVIIKELDKNEPFGQHGSQPIPNAPELERSGPLPWPSNGNQVHGMEPSVRHGDSLNAALNHHQTPDGIDKKLGEHKEELETMLSYHMEHINARLDAKKNELNQLQGKLNEIGNTQGKLHEIDEIKHWLNKVNNDNRVTNKGMAESKQKIEELKNQQQGLADKVSKDKAHQRIAFYTVVAGLPILSLILTLGYIDTRDRDNLNKYRDEANAQAISNIAQQTTSLSQRTASLNSLVGMLQNQVHNRQTG